jgi:hypothetical protein
VKKEFPTSADVQVPLKREEPKPTISAKKEEPELPVVPLPPPVPPTEEHWRAVLFMDEAVSAATPLVDLVSNPKLGLHLRAGPAITGRFYPPGKLTLDADSRLVSFLLEGLGDRLPEAFLHWPLKAFPSPRVVGLRLPVALPVCFTTNGNATTLGFFDTARVSAAETRSIVQGVLDNLSRLDVLVARFGGVDARSFRDTVCDFAHEWDIYLVYSVDKTDKENETLDVTVKMLKSHWEPGLELGIIRAFQDLIDEVTVYTCKKCGLFFSKQDGPTCVTYRHPGKRVPVDGIEMETWEMDEEEEDRVITVVKWSCCGETTLEDPGCTEVGRGDHVIDPTKSAKTAIAFRTGKIID